MNAPMLPQLLNENFEHEMAVSAERIEERKKENRLKVIKEHDHLE